MHYIPPARQHSEDGAKGLRVSKCHRAHWLSYLAVSLVSYRLLNLGSIKIGMIGNFVG